MNLTRREIFKGRSQGPPSARPPARCLPEQGSTIPVQTSERLLHRFQLLLFSTQVCDLTQGIGRKLLISAKAEGIKRTDSRLSFRLLELIQKCDYETIIGNQCFMHLACHLQNGIPYKFGELDNTVTMASPLPGRTHGLLLSVYCIQNIVVTLGQQDKAKNPDTQET